MQDDPPWWLIYRAHLFPWGVFALALALPLAVSFCIKIFFSPQRYESSVTHTAPGPGWICTDERFVDTVTKQVVQVWYHPVSGKRRYVRESWPERDAEFDTADQPDP